MRKVCDIFIIFSTQHKGPAQNNFDLCFFYSLFRLFPVINSFDAAVGNKRNFLGFGLISDIYHYENGNNIQLK